MAHTVEQVWIIIDNRHIADPPHGRRKARVECHWCSGEVIETRWICGNCWKRLPLVMRKEFNRIHGLSKLVGRRNPELLKTWGEAIVKAFDFLEENP